MNTEKIRIIHEFQFKSIIEATNMLLKLVTFYFAIIGASIAYVFSSKISVEIQKALLIGDLIASLFFAVTVIFLSFGIFTGLSDINEGLKSLGRQEYKTTKVNSFIKRGKFVSVLVVFCCVGIVVTLCFVLLWLLLRLHG